MIDCRAARLRTAVTVVAFSLNPVSSRELLRFPNAADGWQEYKESCYRLIGRYMLEVAVRLLDVKRTCE